MSVCLTAAGTVKALLLSSFMLSWANPAEKSERQEDWRVALQGLSIMQVRVNGGMERPSDAQLVDGWFRWTPPIQAVAEIKPAKLGSAGEWRLCTGGSCKTLPEIVGASVPPGEISLTRCAPAQEAAALLERSMAFRAQGERPRALADLDAALRLDPSLEAARAERKSLFGEIERLGAQMPMKAK